MAKSGNKYTHPYDVEYLLAYIVGNMDVTATARVATTAAYDHDNCSTVSLDGGVALTAGEEELLYRLSLTGGYLRDYVQVDPATYANDSTWRWQRTSTSTTSLIPAAPPTTSSASRSRLSWR